MVQLSARNGPHLDCVGDYKTHGHHMVLTAAPHGAWRAGNRKSALSAWPSTAIPMLGRACAHGRRKCAAESAGGLCRARRRGRGALCRRACPWGDMRGRSGPQVLLGRHARSHEARQLALTLAPLLHRGWRHHSGFRRRGQAAKTQAAAAVANASPGKQWGPRQACAAPCRCKA